MPNFSTTVRGLTSLRAKIIAKEKLVNSRILKALKMAAVLVQGTAVKLIQHGPKTGILYGELRYVKLANYGVAIPKAKMSKLHRASAPGEAPATDTGNLARNIGFEIDENRKVASVISRAKYSAALEFGTNDGKILPRPFMQPALNANMSDIKELMAEAVRGS